MPEGPLAAPDAARHYREKYEEVAAVLARVKQYAETMTQDKRMRVMGGILLREIARLEDEEAAKTARGERAE